MGHSFFCKARCATLRSALTPSEGNALLAAATAVSAAIAQGKNADELALLAALFTVIGDNLALLALSVPGNTETPGGTD